MLRAFYLVVTIGMLFLIEPSLSQSQSLNEQLAKCLRVGTPSQRNASADDILRLIHQNQYLIVPASNPPTLQQVKLGPRQPRRSTRDTKSFVSAKKHTLRCPYKFEARNFPHTVPPFLSKAICKGCHVNCKPVFYTHQLLTRKPRKCKNRNVWFWTQKTLAVAFVWVQGE